MMFSRLCAPWRHPSRLISGTVSFPGRKLLRRTAKQTLSTPAGFGKGKALPGISAARLLHTGSSPFIGAKSALFCLLKIEASNRRKLQSSGSGPGDLP